LGVKGVLEWLRRLWRALRPLSPVAVVAEAASPAPLPAPTPIVPPPLPTPKPPKPRPQPIEPSATLKSEILDKLDDYMFFVRRMKKQNPEVYSLYKKIGASIAVGDLGHDRTALSSSWLKSLPGFGAVFITTPPLADSVHPKFIYYRKYEKQPRSVQWVNHGSVYLCGVYFDERNLKLETGGLVEFAVQVLPDGTVNLLRSKIAETQVIAAAKRGAWKGHTTKITHSRWGVDPKVKDWAADNDEAPAQMLPWFFKWAVNAHEWNSTSLIRVACTKGGVTAAFAVDYQIMPGFFRDRDTAGKKKRPIFHVVRTHQRRLPNGDVIPVKMHFAGLRRFVWNGYDVLVTVPGKHHADLAAISVGSHNLEDDEVASPDMMDEAALGEALARHVSGGRI
jgi:hypothetical protein